MSIFNKILVKAGLRAEITLVDKPFPKVDMTDINRLNAHLSSVLDATKQPNVKFSEVVKVMEAGLPDNQPAPVEVPEEAAVFPEAATEEAADEGVLSEAQSEQISEGPNELILNGPDLGTPKGQVKVIQAHVRATTYPGTQAVEDEMAYLIKAGVPGGQAALALRHRDPAESLEAIRDRLLPQGNTSDAEAEQPEFWEVFARRLSARGTLLVNSDKDLLDKKPKLQKGYHLVHITSTNEAGIAHVSKGALAALFPQANGEYRVVTSKRTIHLNGVDTVGEAVAKLFLNGRY